MTRLPKKDPKINYMGPKDGPFLCKECRFYIADNKPCMKVSEPIKAYGCCNAFMKHQDEDPRGKK